VPDYSSVTYQAMAEVTEQWPIVGRGDLYYGGTTYDNNQGLGFQLSLPSQRGEAVSLPRLLPLPVDILRPHGLLLAPFTRLYDHGSLVTPSKLLEKRLVKPGVSLHPETALKFGLTEGQDLLVVLNGMRCSLPVSLDETLPQGVGLVPRSAGFPLTEPVVVSVAEMAGKKD